MKYYSGQSVFKFSWDQVSSSFWQKYPNPMSKHVLSEDTVERKLINKKLYSKRFLSKTNKLPKWGERVFPSSMTRSVFIVEETVVDPKKKTMTTYTRNVGLTNMMLIEERCTYRPSTENKNWTVCERQAWISSSMFGVSYALQAFGYDRFKKNINKAVRGFEHVLTRMYTPETPAALEHPVLQVKAEKLKEKAKKAKDLAKSKAAASVAVTS